MIDSLKKGILLFADKNEASLMSKVHFEETSEDEDEEDSEEAEVNGAEQEEDEPSQLEIKVNLTISNY